MTNLVERPEAMGSCFPCFLALLPLCPCKGAAGRGRGGVRVPVVRGCGEGWVDGGGGERGGASGATLVAYPTFFECALLRSHRVFPECSTGGVGGSAGGERGRDKQALTCTGGVRRSSGFYRGVVGKQERKTEGKRGGGSLTVEAQDQGYHLSKE
eukprot:763724-Hanusia_phi.AAC.1